MGSSFAETVNRQMTIPTTDMLKISGFPAIANEDDIFEFLFRFRKNIKRIEIDTTEDRCAFVYLDGENTNDAAKEASQETNGKSFLGGNTVSVTAIKRSDKKSNEIERRDYHVDEPYDEEEVLNRENNPPTKEGVVPKKLREADTVYGWFKKANLERNADRYQAAEKAWLAATLQLKEIAEIANVQLLGAASTQVFMDFVTIKLAENRSSFKGFWEDLRYLHQYFYHSRELTDEQYEECLYSLKLFLQQCRFILKHKKQSFNAINVRTFVVNLGYHFFNSQSVAPDEFTFAAKGAFESLQQRLAQGMNTFDKFAVKQKEVKKTGN